VYYTTRRNNKPLYEPKRKDTRTQRVVEQQQVKSSVPVSLLGNDYALMVDGAKTGILTVATEKPADRYNASTWLSPMCTT